MNTVKVNIQSDVFYQVKPIHLSQLEELIETGSKHAKCKFTSKETVQYFSEKTDEMWAAHCLNLSNLQVYNLLSKAMRIVQDTEEYTSYLLNKTFGEEKNRSYSTPPGTIRVYSEDLICFYNGKTWRKIKL